MIPKAGFIMAAGLGTRLQPLTRTTPKAFVPVLGVPGIQFALDQLLMSGVTQVLVNIHHLASQARIGLQLLDWGSSRRMVLDESALLLGSGGGMVQAFDRAEGPGPLLITNADVVYSLEHRELFEQHQRLRRSHGVWMTLALTRRPIQGGVYREFLHQSGLAAELGPPTAQGWFYSGTGIFEASAFENLNPGTAYEFVPSILEPALKQRKVGVLLAERFWMDTGTPAFWASAHFEWMRRLEWGFPLSAVEQVWRKRIESVSRRVGEMRWVSREAPRKGIERMPYASYLRRTDWIPTGDSEVGSQLVVYSAGLTPEDWRSGRCGSLSGEVVRW